ncbi:MAG: threonine--tRNA ligase, partial [Thermotogae bacterium]|nr:threonine--tRNA ligase [Thermotogota bacterium]
MKLRYRGDILKFPNGITGKEIVNKLNPDGNIVGLILNDQFHDLLTPLNLPDGEYEVEFIKIDDPRSAEFFRHTMAHIMAQAVMRIFGKDVKLGIGPTIENGFYYDFDV